MALIECGECGNKVSDTAPACPQCGARVAAESKSAGVVLVTTQGTSKKIKLMRVVGAGMAVAGLVIVVSMPPVSQGGSGAFLGTLLFVVGFGLYVYARVQKWWHHD